MAEAGCRFVGNKNSNVTMFNSSKLLKLAGPDVFSTWEVRWDKCYHTMDPDIWVENEQVWAQFSVDSILNFYSIKREERPYIQGFSKMDRDLYVVIAKKSQRGEVQRDKFILRFEGEFEQGPAKSLSLKAFKDSIRHQVVDTFLAATLSHDRKAIMELMSKEYVEKRHDQALGGNTIQFIDEFYGVSLEEITGIKRTSLHPDHKGDEMTFEVSVGSETKACILYLKQCFDKHGRIDFRFFRRGDG